MKFMVFINKKKPPFLHCISNFIFAPQKGKGKEYLQVLSPEFEALIVGLYLLLEETM